MTEQTQNPLLARLRMPGATFRLPSQGLFYTDGEMDPSVKNGEVEVYPMTTIDEIIISTPDKLLSGKAIIEVFERCIPQIKKPIKLLARDVDFLMIALRVVTYGDTMDVNFEHNCDKAKEHTYQINLNALIRETRSVDPTTLSTEYNLTLSNQQHVSLRPLTYEDMISLYQISAMSTDNITAEDAEKLIVDGLVSVIASVDGVSDRAMIRQWVSALPIGIKREIERVAQKVTPWGVKFQVPHKCKDCKTDIEIGVSANPIDFFS